MLTTKWITKTVAILAITIAMIAATTTTALAAGPDVQIIIVHVTDGAGDSRVDFSPADDNYANRELVIEVNDDGVSAYGFSYGADGTLLGGWGAGPDDVHDEQVEDGDTATGLLAADQNCREHQNCHVVLVNYRQPASREHRVAAKAAADQLAANGHRLHAVAVGPDSSGHVGFNWYLSGGAWNAPADEAVALVDQISTYAYLARVISFAGHATATDSLADAWNELSPVEKIWLNPMGCNLETQWLWAYDATCHDKR